MYKTRIFKNKKVLIRDNILTLICGHLRTFYAQLKIGNRRMSSPFFLKNDNKTTVENEQIIILFL